MWRHELSSLGCLHMHPLKKLALWEAQFHFFLDKRKAVDGSIRGQILLFCSGVRLFSDLLKADMMSIPQWLLRLFPFRVDPERLLDWVVLTQNYCLVLETEPNILNVIPWQPMGIFSHWVKDSAQLDFLSQDHEQSANLESQWVHCLLYPRASLVEDILSVLLLVGLTLIHKVK